MTLTLDLPLGLDPERVRLHTAISLFQDGEVGVGKAAQVAGMSYRAFWDELTKRGIPVIIYDDAEDIRLEIESVRRITGSPKEKA